LFDLFRLNILVAERRSRDISGIHQRSWHLRLRNHPVLVVHLIEKLVFLRLIYTRLQSIRSSSFWNPFIHRNIRSHNPVFVVQLTSSWSSAGRPEFEKCLQRISPSTWPVIGEATSLNDDEPGVYLENAEIRRCLDNGEIRLFPDEYECQSVWGWNDLDGGSVLRLIVLDFVHGLCIESPLLLMFGATKPTTSLTSGLNGYSTLHTTLYITLIKLFFVLLIYVSSAYLFYIRLSAARIFSLIE